MMIPSVLEKLAYGIAVVVLYLQSRMRSDLQFAIVDLLFAALFLVAFLRMGAGPVRQS